jgi:hypothetical protein
MASFLPDKRAELIVVKAMTGVGWLSDWFNVIIKWVRRRHLVPKKNP